jgi:hypothetical protein
VKQITITESGRVLVRKAIEDRFRWMKDLANNLTPTQQEQIISSLKTLTEAAKSLEEAQEEEFELQRMKV